MNAELELVPESGTQHWVFPASFAQQRLWFLEQLEGAGPVWNVRLPVRLTGTLDLGALEQALATVVARHEALRTTLQMRAGEILQVVASALTVPVERVALPGATEDELRTRLGELCSSTFDLREGPLLRVFLVELAPADHVLLILSHHCVSDAWSSGVLFRDLAATYTALTRPEPISGPPLLPALPIQYADFAVWQRDWLAGPELERQAAFWREHLKNAPGLLDLPVDRPRPRLQSYRGHRLGHGLTAELTAQLQALAVTEGVTLFMLLFAAFNLLLARWSGQRDLVIGTPIAGRRRTELEGLVGFFANTLALRTRIGEGENFRQLLLQVRATALAAFTHQDLPFEKLVEVLQPPRSLAHAPVFQVLFVLQNAPWDAAGFGALRVAPAEIAPAATARFDLTVSASEFEGQLWLGLEYSTDLFDAGTIGRLAAGFEALLTAIVAAPGSPLATLPVQAEADRCRQLQEWQPAPTPSSGPESIYALFHAQVGRTPEVTAVECGDTRLSYAALEARAGETAARLLAAGMDPAVPVALCLERSVDMLAAVLGVLRAGGHYLPLDPGHPPVRRASLLQDSGAALLVSTPVEAGQSPTISRVGTHGRAAATAGDSPAYLIYTSGSTGRPKGVLVGQRAVVNFLSSMATVPGLHPGDRLLAVTTLAFDIAVLELLLPLTVGATTVIATEEDLRDPQQLLALLATAGITTMQATPALWRNLLAAGWSGTPGLRLLCGGEALDRELATALLGAGAELWNLYGPTETTVWSCCERVRAEAGPVSIGRPIGNTRCYVLDEELQPVPIGAHGELWIGGDGVALGYHGQPALTAERFRADPFRAAEQGGGRMYGTGDRARWRADGRLEVLGRQDFQVKLRGFRIEPVEIEAALLAQPGVSAAVVVLREVAGDPRLVAFLVAGDVPVPDAVLLAALRESLPAYLVPSHLLWLAALPLTPNGKLDRGALPPAGAPLGANNNGVPPVGAPATALETALGNLFGELLGAPVGLDDDFFGRGGHSLLATRLVARIRGDLQADVSLRNLFETPTVRGLAATMPARGRVGAVVEGSRRSPLLQPLLQATTAPVSLVQQRLWFLDRLAPGNSAYHLAWAFELQGPLERQALQRALDELAARHSSLRTHFRDQDGEPLQVIGAARGWPLEIVAGASALPAQLTALATAPLQLSRGPLIRAVLIEQTPEVHTLLIVIHHILADGWSLGVLSRELALHYAAARRGKPVLLPDLAMDYVGYAREQRRSLAGGELARQLAYWQTQLRDLQPCIDLPTDRPRPAVASGKGARLARTLPPALQSAVTARARAEGCTVFVVLLTAFDLLLARYAGTEDVVVGTPIAGRPRTELEGLVGFFVNTLVLRTSLTGNPTVRELLGRVRAMTLAAFEHAEVPFELLVETLQPPRSTSRTPLFQVLFNLHSEPHPPLGLEGLKVRPLPIPRHTAKFELSVSLAETAAGLAVSIEYSTDLFLPASMARLLDDYAGLLAALVAAPEARLTALPFSPGEPEILRSVVPLATELSLPAAFAAQVARRPDALAVSAPATGGCLAIDWTYAQLAREARAIATALINRGLQPGERVGLWFGQGAGQVAGMLGVLQAGGVYVPLDLLAPAARLASVSRDAGLRVLVTDRSAPVPPPAGLLALAREELPASGDSPSFPTVAPDPLAYLLYTSGSTGTPKGVPQTHRNVLHFIRAWAANLGLTPDDRLSLFSTSGYDAAVQDIFGALLTGAAVCPLDVRGLDRETLLDRVADRGLTVLHGTPTVYRYLFGGRVACRQDLSRVRLVVLGGEVARRADFELFRARFRPGARFVNGYGLTEATAVTQWLAGHATRPYGQQLPIGRPVGGLTLELVDEAGAPAALVGELVIESSHVTPGYWPSLTRPRRFHTGDRARYLPDGNLVFVGRVDERLKIAGIRIEPGDIEAALRSLPALSEAVVLAPPDSSGEPVLVAYYTSLSGEPAPTVRLLRAHLATLLPAALIPARFILCKDLPRLPNGKVDRHALARSGRAWPATGSSFEERLSDDGEDPVAGQAAPADHIHATLQDLWQRLLQRESVGLDEDFFLLGGHSLLATRLVARIRDRLGVEVPLIRVFEAPTIRGLARFL